MSRSKNSVSSFVAGVGVAVEGVGVGDLERRVRGAVVLEEREQHAELGAVVADVVHAVELMAEVLVDVRERVADDRRAQVADVHLPAPCSAPSSRRRRAPCARRAATPARSSPTRSLILVGEPRRVDREVDEAGRRDGRRRGETGDVERGGELLGDRERRLLQLLGQLHRDRGRVVAVLRISGVGDDGAAERSRPARWRRPRRGRAPPAAIASSRP